MPSTIRLTDAQWEIVVQALEEMRNETAGPDEIDEILRKIR